MTRVAYLAHQFPSTLEPYVTDEIEKLRACGVVVIASSARRAQNSEEQSAHPGEDVIYLWPVRPWLLIRAIFIVITNFSVLADLLKRIFLKGKESPSRRLRALAHTWIGAYYALLLRPARVDHIHVHHGYFASWIAMVAARLLGVSYSITLHGSDLLLHPMYLDAKLQNCKFCMTVSEFNRQRLLTDYPDISPDKIIVQHLGVDLADDNVFSPMDVGPRHFVMLAVGRLHPVKDHAFLLRACSELKKSGLKFRCRLAGEGPERSYLQSMIQILGLQEEVRLLGHLSRRELVQEYESADLVVLTSRSEGIPLVLMEAMARGRIALAPDITGIPELITDGRTGFLYSPGSLAHFIALVKALASVAPLLDHIRRAARQQVEQHFNRRKNLEAFAEMFLTQVSNTGSKTENTHADSVLQQVQFSLQRY